MDGHLFLIGMMGCGKSTLGRHLSPLLGRALIDLDEAIVAYEGRSIPKLFAEGGDAFFRERETAALRRAIAAPAGVIATGGGIITREENIALMRAHGLVVWLRRPIEEILLSLDASGRPNLAGDAEARMRSLYAQREAHYARAAHVCFDLRQTPADAARTLAQLPEVQQICRAARAKNNAD